MSPKLPLEQPIEGTRLGIMPSRRLYVSGSLLLLGLAAVVAVVVGMTRRDPIVDIQSDDDKVRSKAVEQLAAGATDEQIVKLCELALVSDSPEVRWRCIHALGYTKSTDAVPALIKCLGDSHWGVRSSAVCALRDIGDKRAVAPMVAVLGDPELEVQAKAANFFWRFRHPDVAAVVIPKLIYDNPKNLAYINDANRAFVYALGNQGDRSALPSLNRMLDYPHEEFARDAAMAIGQILGLDFTEQIPGERSCPPITVGSPTKAKAYLRAHPELLQEQVGQE